MKDLRPIAVFILIVGLAAGLTFGIYLLRPASSAARAHVASPDEVCESRLERIGRAIRKYREEKGSLPHTLVGPAGHKISWRVALAPYLTNDIRYLRYHEDEPWDSVYNRPRLRTWMQGVYTCRAECEQVDCPYVSYLMLERNKPEGAAKESVPPVSLPDDAVLVVESAQCKIEYAEPRDIDFDTLFSADSPFGVGRLNSLHPSYVRAVRCDGKVIEIPKNISKDDLRKLLMGGAQ